MTLPAKLEAALGNGFAHVDALLPYRATGSTLPQVPTREIADVLARGILEGYAAALAGVAPPPPRFED